MTFEPILEQLRALRARFDLTRPQLPPEQCVAHDKRARRIDHQMAELLNYDPEFDDMTPEDCVHKACTLRARLEASLPELQLIPTLTLTVYADGIDEPPVTVDWDGVRWLLRGIGAARSVNDAFALRQQLVDIPFASNDLELWRVAAFPEQGALDGPQLGPVTLQGQA